MSFWKLFGSTDQSLSDSIKQIAKDPEAMTSLETIASKFRNDELNTTLNRINTNLEALLSQRNQVENLKSQTIVGLINEIGNSSKALDAIGKIINTTMAASDQYYKNTYLTEGKMDVNKMLPAIMKEILVNEMMFILNKNGAFDKVIHSLAIDLLKEVGIIEESATGEIQGHNGQAFHYWNNSPE